MATVRGYGLFSDEVFSSTDLNRRSGEVLNRANKAPVTIARNNERFALLRRDQAASLVKAVGQSVEVLQLVQGALALRANSDAQILPGIAWIEAFDDEDRLTMLNDVIAASVQASAEDDWDSVADLIHQWRESASAIEIGALRKAMATDADEQPLPEPKSIAGVE